MCVPEVFSVLPWCKMEPKYIFFILDSGASCSKVILLNGKGEEISEAEGPATNQWVRTQRHKEEQLSR